jgi:mono/diheme cytochrome c family protein
MAVVALLWSLPVAAQDSATRRAPEVYDKWCVPCHGAGENKPGTISAAALYKGAKPAVLAERADLTPAGIRSVVRKGMYIMPRFRKTEVSDAELETIVAFLVRASQPPAK